MIRKTAPLFALAFVLAPVGAVARPPADAAITRTGDGQLSLSWSSLDPVDVLVAESPRASLKSAKLVSPRDADGRHILSGNGTQRSYFILRDVRTGETTRVAERLVPLEAGSNFRDIGGYAAAGGKHVRWGLIYRSGATPLLTPADRERIKGLGLASMVDLRSDEERVLAPSRIDGVPYVAVGYSMGALMAGADGTAGMGTVYRRLPQMMAPQLRQIFAALLRAEGPVAYNCSAGQDRTGFATAVILSALGTDHAAIVGDYHLSTQYRRPEFEMPRLDPAQHPGDPVVALFSRYQDDPRARMPQPLKTADGKPYLDFAFAEMHDKWGGVEGYLHREIGLTARDITRLRALYTN